MANQVSFLGYSRASGRTPFLRIYEVTFSGDYTVNYGEVIDFNTALNPNGLEDAQVPNPATSFAPPFVLGSTTSGWKAELEIGGNGTPGEVGINFFNGDTQLTAVAYSSVFPANGSNYGQVLIGVLSAE